MLIKDMETGKVREYGTNRHDSLVISPDGRYLYYENLQNGDGSIGGYRFVIDEEGHVPEDNRDCFEIDKEYFNIGGWHKENEK